MDNNKQQSLSKGFVILSIASISVKLMSLIYVPIMQKLLGPAGYGIMGSANTVFAFVYVLATAGMPVAISKIVTELTAQGNTKSANQSFRLARTVLFIIGFICMAFLIAFSKPIASLMNVSEIWAGLCFIAPTILLCSIMAAYRGYFQGKRNMTPTAVSQIVEQIINVIVSVIMVLLLRDKGIIWAVAGSSIGTTSGSFFALIMVMMSYRNFKKSEEANEVREQRLRVKKELESLNLDSLVRTKTSGKNTAGLYRPDADLRLYSETRPIVKKYTAKQLLKKLAYYSIPITMAAGIQFGGNMIDASFVVGRLIHGGFSATDSKIMYGGLYATTQLINVPSAIITALCISILPTLAALYAVKNNIETSSKANYGFKLCYMVAFPLATAMAIFAPQIYTVLGFSSDPTYLSALALSVLLLGTVHLQSSILQSVNCMFTSTIFLTIMVVVKAVLNYFLVPTSLNIYGAIIATYVSYLIPMILNHFVLYHKKGVRISLLGNSWRPALSSGVMLVGSFIVYYILHLITSLILNEYLAVLIAFIPTVAVGIVLYFYMLARLGGISESDVNSVSPAIMKLTNKILAKIKKQG